MQAPASITPKAGDLRAGGPRLRQAITGPLLFLFILGDVLGAGVYALVGKIAGEVGGAIWLPLLVALGFAMLTAASYAELVTKYPKAGGAAVFAARAFRRPLLSFLVGFCMLSAGVTSAAGLSLAFAGDYLGAIVDLRHPWCCRRTCWPARRPRCSTWCAPPTTACRRACSPSLR